jgi:hypothetical protein
VEVQYSRENESYFIKEKIDNQTFFMEFQIYDETDDTIYINICMGIYNKRKHVERNENEVRMTGLNPMKSVATAIRAFNLLEKEILKRRTSKRKHISCGWVDNRRRDAYYKFLSKRGYQYGTIGRYKCIYKVYE